MKVKKKTYLLDVEIEDQNNDKSICWMDFSTVERICKTGERFEKS